MTNFPKNAIIAAIALFSVALVAGAPRDAQAKAKIQGVEIGKKQSQRLYDIAYARYQSYFGDGSLKATFQRIADGKEKLTPELTTHIKTARLSANILRSTFIMVDKSHQKLPALHLLVRDAGRLNDAVSHNNMKIVPDLAKTVVAHLENPQLKKEITSFRPAGKKSVNGYLQASLQAVERALAKDKLTAPQFHQVRKDVTHVQSLFDRGTSLGIGKPINLNDPAAKKLWNSLEKIRHSMGEVHDKLADGKINKTINYETTLVKIPKKLKGEIAGTVKSLRIPEKSVKKAQKYYQSWKQNVSRAKRVGKPSFKAKKAKRAKVRG